MVDVDLDEIAVVCREDETNEIKDFPTYVGKNPRRLERKALSGISSDDPRGGPSSCRGRGNAKVDESGELMGQPTEGKKEGPMSRQEHLRTRFYKNYQREAEEYDREFMKKYDDDLNTTLIFAGLFSAVTAAFVVVVHAEFQPNPSDETNALLRIIIHNQDSTAFGGEAPTIPKWTGPPPSTVQVQAMLLASLSVSLLAAFLAMLGKQWLNRCIPADMRGTIIERSQYRQRKLDGIVNWYFDYVMESLPLMLQAALLLLASALSRYLWETNTTVASVVICVTASGLLFYFFIVVAGAVSVNCPYQTPGASFLRRVPDIPGHIPHILRRIQDVFRSIWGPLRRIPHLFRRIRDKIRRVPDILRHLPHIPGALHSVLSGESMCYASLEVMVELFEGAYHSPHNIPTGLLKILYLGIVLLPIGLIVDAFRVMIWLLAGFNHWVQDRSEPQAEQTTEQRAVARLLDLRCISWTLRMSVDEPVRVSALEYLTTMTLGDPDPIQNVVDWFGSLTNCVKVIDGNTIIVQGLEQLAAKSSLVCLHALSHLVIMDPMPNILEDVRQQYTRNFPIRTNLDGLPFSHALGIIHSVLSPKLAVDFGGMFRTRNLVRRQVQWNDYEPSSDVYIVVARALTKFAWFGYQRSGHAKVPRWILRFALHSLSQDPLPPVSVIADSFSIIGIELECNAPNLIAEKPLDESAQVAQTLGPITEKLVTLVNDHDRDTLYRKRKAITALFPYAAWQERDNQCGILGVFLDAAKTSRSAGFLWHHIEPFFATLLSGASHVSLKRAATLASPYFLWWSRSCCFKKDKAQAAQAWVTTASAVPREKEIAPSAVDVLLQIAHLGLLQPNHSEVWSWLTLQPSLPPICEGRRLGSDSHVVQTIRNLKDIEILKSYLVLIWSEWNSLRSGFPEMCNSIPEDFGGIEMYSHRGDLMQRLDHVLGHLDRGLAHLRYERPNTHVIDLQKRKDQYGELRTILLETDRKTLEILTQSHSTFMCALPIPCP